MKKIIFCITVSFLCLSHSAQAQCRVLDPNVTEWAKKNREKLDTMTRIEWQELEEDYRWAAWFVLSPKQSHKFFKQKLEQVRDSFEWSKEEKEHINKFVQFVINNPDLHYDESSRNLTRNEIAMFQDEWIRFAREKLNWSINLVFGVIGLPADLLDKEGNIKTVPNVEVTPKMNFQKLDLKE